MQADKQQMLLLNTPLGIKGSGAIRYAAAMHFYQRGEMTGQNLEIYRSLAKDDATDPQPLLFEC